MYKNFFFQFLYLLLLFGLKIERLNNLSPYTQLIMLIDPLYFHFIIHLNQQTL